ARAVRGNSSPTRPMHDEVKLPLQVLVKTDADPEEVLPTAKSRRPSPLKSPNATERGLRPTAKFLGAPKVPSPLPRSTLTVPWRKNGPPPPPSRDTSLL